MSKKVIIKPIANTSNKLRLNGFYFRIEDIKPQNNIVKIYYMYQNGVIARGGSKQYENETELNIFLDTFSKESYNENSKAGSSFGFWGAYFIKSDSIMLVLQGFGPGRAVFENHGNIINDTTFILNKGGLFQSNKLAIYQPEKYQFRQTISKPDSINIFFK